MWSDISPSLLRRTESLLLHCAGRCEELQETTHPPSWLFPERAEASAKPRQDLPRGHKYLRKVLKLRTAGETWEEKIIFYHGLWCSTEHFFINFASYLAKCAFVFLPNAVGNRTSPTCQPIILLTLEDIAPNTCMSSPPSAYRMHVK